jgi:hypothetical protein
MAVQGERDEGEVLIGASVSDQSLFDALRAHERSEGAVIREYEDFARRTGSELVRYLIGIIVDDERRHHRFLEELANSVRTSATFEERGPRLPFFDVSHDDPELRETTKRFLDVERRDRAELKQLARSVRDAGNELDAFVVSLMRDDTERHIAMLRFIERLSRSSPLVRSGHRPAARQTAGDEGSDAARAGISSPGDLGSRHEGRAGRGLT